MKQLAAWFAAMLMLLAAPASAQQTAPAWIERSNQYTTRLLEMDARFSPEGAAQQGLEAYDGLAVDLGPRLAERYVAAAQAMRAEFAAALARESDPLVRQDLAILIASLDQSIEGQQLGERLTLAWADVPQLVFGNLRAALDAQLSAGRQAKAKELLERYVGLRPGTTPLTELAKARWAESQGPGKVGPYRGSVEDALPKIPTYVTGIRALFAERGIEARAALEAMERQFTEYGAWERAEVLPRARPDFRLPPELYAFQLKAYGIDIPPAELVSRARRGFYDTRAQMEALAPLVAAKFGFGVTDYPSVIDELKKQVVPQERLEARYGEVMAEMEKVIRRERIVTMPDYPVLMRVGSPAENAASPAPHMLPPRLIGNTGERGQFVLTTGAPPSPNDPPPNDFNFDAAAWTLSAHEGRPGHELQFGQMVARGVSQARAIYAFNSTNAEGWGLYAEAEMLPYEPVEGQLIALQHRLLRTSRAMLDPMLNLGQTDIETARRILSEEARFSPAMVKQEIDRYTFRAPGQAGSYYYGYTRLADLRMEAELALGAKFDRLAFNDFLIGQGLLPLDLLAKAVREEFIPAQRAP